jgi:hypothetical protein
MERSASEPELDQLVSAFLQLHEDRVRRRGIRRGRKVRRSSVMFALARHLLPFKSPQSFVSQERASRLYQQRTDKDMVTALLEINTIEHQLSLLDDRRALRAPANEGAQRLASSRELEVAARALLRYYLQGQNTDDSLFEATQTAFQEVWKAENERTSAIMEGTGKGHREASATASAKEIAALNTYLRYWDQWLGGQLNGQRVKPED